MSTKRAPNRRPSEPAEVVVEHVPAPDAEERLRRAYDLILRAAARIEAEASSKPPAYQEVKDDAD